MFHALRTNARPTLLATLVLGAVVLALPASAQSDRGGNTGGVGGGSTGGRTGGGGAVISDIVAVIPSPPYSMPANMTTATRAYANLALAAMGGATTLSQIKRVDMICEMESATTRMSIRCTSSSTGAMRFMQTVEGLNPAAPARTVCVEYVPNEKGLKVGDGKTSQTIDAPDEAIQVFRRSADMWNPVLTALGQFESVERVDRVTFAGRPCLALALGRPRLPGLESGVLYLDATTYLPVGQVTNVVRDILISGTTTILEWQTISDIKVPLTIQIDGPDGVATLRIKAVNISTTDSSIS